MGRLYAWLNPDVTGRFSLFAWIIVTLVLVSLAALAFETELTHPDTPIEEPQRSQWLAAILQLNQIVVWVFAAEFVLRFISEGENPDHRGFVGHTKFLVSPIAIADFLAFAPELIVMLLFPHLDPPWLAALKALRLFRLFKLARYVPAFGIVGAAVSRASAPLLASLAIAAAQVYIAALTLYFVEGQNKPDEFGSITRALWWAVVTLTTVGYGDVFPDTILGRIAAGLIAVAGIGIVAMPTGILASAFAEEFRERYEAKQRALRETVEESGEDT
jgi:voltage-gated potassium channel